MSKYKCKHCHASFSTESGAKYHSCSGSSSGTLDSIVDFATGYIIGSMLDSASGSDYTSSSSSDSSSSPDYGDGGSFSGGGSSDSW